MDVQLRLLPWNLTPNGDGLFTANISYKDTVRTFKHNLVKPKNKQIVVDKDSHFIWAGCVFPDETILFEIGLTSSSTISLIPPSALLPGASLDFMNVFQDLQYHFEPNKLQVHDTSHLDLIQSFVHDLSNPHALWKPSGDDLQLLQWALEVLRRSQPPAHQYPSITWYGEYGCALIARQTNSEDVALVLVCLDSWRFQIFSGLSERVHFSVPDDRQSTLLSVGHAPLKNYGAFLAKVAQKLETVKKRKGNDRTSAKGHQGHHKTPGMIYAVLREIVEALNVPEYRKESEIIPKGGFTDVGLHTGGMPRNTSWHLVLAVVKHLLHVESKGADALFRQLLAQLPLRMSEFCVAHYLSEVRNPTSGLVRDSNTCRKHTDTIMQTLSHSVQQAALFWKQSNCDEEMMTFEARCIRVRHELEQATDIRSKLAAKQFTLCPLPPHEVLARDLTLSVPAESVRKNVESSQDILETAFKNLKILPNPPSGDASWAEMKSWMEKHCSSFKGKFLKQQIICKAVEGFFFQKILIEDECMSSKTIEKIMDQYRIVARAMQECAESKAVNRAELISRELLVVWISFCLVHQVSKQNHPLVAEFSVALNANDLRFLFLSERRAVDAARRVIRYLRNNETGVGPIFSLCRSDQTLDLGLRFAEASERIGNVWKDEKEEMEKRERERWATILGKKNELEQLDRQLTDLISDHGRALANKETLEEPWVARCSDLRPYCCEKPQSLIRAENVEKDLRARISRKKSEIKGVEKAPAPILQPLPANKTNAMQVLFFLFLPRDLEILCHLSFLSQQMLLPCHADVPFNPSPGVETEISIDKEIEDRPPKFFWNGYYTQLSTARKYQPSVKPDKVISGSRHRAQPSDTSWYKHNVRKISSPSDGVWHPDKIERELFWKGGVCTADVGSSNRLYINPFTEVDPQAIMCKFTERIEQANDSSLQWAIYQKGEETPDIRGNYAMASQHMIPKWLSSRNNFFNFCTIRAYPFQQIRRLCAILSEGSLSLMRKQVHILIQQTFHQIGQVSCDASSEREWYTDLQNFSGWASLREILDNLCEELRSKSREFASLMTLGELTAQVSQWDSQSRVVARKFANIAEKAADELAEVELNSKESDIPVIRARRHILYVSCLTCHSAGELSDEDVAQICKTLALADYTKLFEDPTPYDEDIRNLAASLKIMMASRILTLLKRVRHQPQMLTNAVQKVHAAAPHEMSWEAIPVENEPSSSFLARGSDGHMYFLNLLTGTVLVDGNPPSRLPYSILSNSLYQEIFGYSNFEVVRTSDGILKTLRRISGYFYTFFESSNGLVIREFDGIDVDSTLELLNSTRIETWGSDLPPRLKNMHSHWLSRSCHKIILRPKHFRNRKVNFIMSREGRLEGDAEDLQSDGARKEQWREEDQRTWSCFKIPKHLEDWKWHEPIPSICHKLVYLMDGGSRRLLQVLSKFESFHKCIHAYQYPQKSSKSSKSYLVELPRFGLEFELADDGAVLSNSFSTYKLSTEQNYDDTLMDFSQYLILESGEIQKVLIPAGEVSKASGEIKVLGAMAENANRRFHIYSVHPRFKTLHAVAGKESIEARLFLAALYAATGTMLPEKRISKTGSEQAIEQMRQSWKNSPMTPSETAHLLSICSFGQLYPTLSLLAHELFSSSQMLNFLPFSIRRSKHDVALNREASTEYGLKKKGHQLNPRALLTDDEERHIFGFSMARSVEKREWTDKRLELGHGVPASTAMKDIKMKLKKMLCIQKGKEDHLPAFPFPPEDSDKGAIDNKMRNDLSNSWDVHVKLPTQKLSSPTVELAQQQVATCLVRCTDLRTAMEEFVNGLVGKIPGDGFGISCFRMRRSANLEPNAHGRDLLKIACRLDKVQLYNPFLATENSDKIRLITLEWMDLCVMEDKLRRMVSELGKKNIAEVIRELNEVDRSWLPNEHSSWLAFEVEEQLQIRDVQYKVAKFCLLNPSKITQLNMGEGKTRVILPMLILELAKGQSLTRIHFLSPVISEAYDFLHGTITTGVCNLRILMMPFNRDIKLTRSQATKLLESLDRCQNNGGVICVTPEHRLSLLLKKSELDLQNSASTRSTREVLQKINSLSYIDVFDESDELLHHRYQLIYAVGACIPLSAGKERWAAAQAVLEQLQFNDEVDEILQVVAKRERFNDRFPGSLDNIRLLPDNPDDVLQAFSRQLATAICHDPPYHMRWLKGSARVDDFVSFVTEKDKNLTWLHQQVANCELSAEQKDCLLALRGILAYGLLQNVLSLRYRVDYGIDPRRKNRKVAVPYRASDMPCERAEYAHPDTLILFTYLAYFYKGLSKNEIREAVEALLQMGAIAQREEYGKCLKRARLSSEPNLKLIDNVDKFDPEDDAQMTVMHRVYQYNMDMISFWLDTCVLPKETRQFPQRLSANAFHLTNNKKGKIIGFSGTKDNSILLPIQVKQELPDISQVQATDGKMLDLMLKNDVMCCLPSSVALPEACLRLCIEKEVSALIDAGALMAGLENKQVAERVIKLLQDHAPNVCLGVVFYDKGEASWMVLSLDGRCWPLGSSPIRERDAFVYFDESHCRGADMKLRTTASAILTIGPGMCKDKIMQAAGRMRKLDRGQSLIFAVPAEIALKMPVGRGSSLKSKDALEWVIRNTAKATAKGLISWGAQGSLYYTTQNGQDEVTDELLELNDLYQHEVQLTPISKIVSNIQFRHKQRVARAGKVVGSENEIKLGEILARSHKYGGDQSLIQSEADEECEREIENERELEQEKEVWNPKKEPCKQETWDYGILLRTLDKEKVLRLTSAVSLAESMTGAFVGLGLDGISWDNCNVFLTNNFLSTVREEDGSQVCNLSYYLRPVDAVIFFDDGRSCLLLSEWEADKVLRTIWKHCRENDTDGAMLITYVNFDFLFPSKPELARGICHFCIPKNTSAEAVVCKASARTLAGLQLFGGRTMFQSELQKTALREMLATDQAKRSALQLISLRGFQHMVHRSELADICYLQE